MTRVFHTIPPVFNKDSEILILGSFPSIKSREGAFFYHHPQNRFWHLLAEIYGSNTPKSIEEKMQFLLERHIALWDVIESCEITASSDSSIRGVKPNDLSLILRNAPVKRIFTNGNMADSLYKKYLLKASGIPATKLPSTSPANAKYSFQLLIDEWKVIVEEHTL